MGNISNEELRILKERFPSGERVKLVYMDDPKEEVTPGEMGTIQLVDDAGTIHVIWDSGVSLGMVHNKDVCIKDDPVEVVCYGKKEHWDSRFKAIDFYAEGMGACEGSERCRYAMIVTNLLYGDILCSDGEVLQ